MSSDGGTSTIERRMYWPWSDTRMVCGCRTTLMQGPPCSDGHKYLCWVEGRADRGARVLFTGDLRAPSWSTAWELAYDLAYRAVRKEVLG